MTVTKPEKTLALIESLFAASLLCLLLMAVGCNKPNHPEFVAVQSAPASGELYADEISPVEPPKRVTIVHASGESTVACGTCHATREPQISNNSSDDLDEFHAGLTFAHGALTCLACHNGDDYDTLHLADGRSLPFTEVRTLCAQCHGPQYRDYLGGSHGGGSGYWDNRRGPLKRNDCVHCHDPHSPAFPKMTPTFKSRDRFLTPNHDLTGQHDEH